MSWGRSIKILIMFFVLFLEILGNIIFPEPNIVFPANFYNCPNDVIEYLTDTSFNDILLQESTNQSHITISVSNSYIPNKTWKNSTIGYSPIVAYFPFKLTDNKYNNFHRVGTSSSEYYLMIDMKTIIMTFVENNTDSLSSTQLGFNEEINNIHLGIPSEECGYRKDVVDSIIYLITDGKGIDEDNKDEVINILNKILNLSIDIKNPVHYMTENSDCIVLMPEYLITECQDTNYPVYWNNAYCIQMKLWYDENKEAVEQPVQLYINNIKEYDKLFYKTGVRSYARQYINMCKLYHCCPKISILENTDTSNFENLLGTKYWL